MRTLKPYLNHGAQPFFHRGGNHGCLCLHGFSAAPAEIKWLADHLAHAGMTTYTPRLAGHGTDPADMRRMRWEDWYLSARDGLEILRQQCDQVYVSGISMGGLLALLLASAESVSGVAAMAPPLYLDSAAANTAKYTHWLRPMSAVGDQTMLPQTIREEQYRRGEPVVGRVNYSIWSAQAVAELVELGEVTRAQLHEVTAPLIAIFATHDDAVPIGNHDLLKRSVRSTALETHILPVSKHIIPQDVERETAFRLIEAFFNRYR